MIVETVESIRYHRPNDKIIIMQDGIRPEQESRSTAYAAYLRDLAQLAALCWHGVTLFIGSRFRHQAAMTLEVLLAHVDTPLLMFVEHDTPLIDKPIDWSYIQNSILFGLTNSVRLHYDDQIHPDHVHLCPGRLTQHLIKTVQWHQRPHIAKTAWYAQTLSNNFKSDSRCFIEDKMYSPVVMAPWEDYKLTIYDPEGTGLDMKRSRDLNGRGAEQKYEQVW